ncbi:hypothetical protein GCM10023217_17510 [Gordonia alkaliphila]|uniref:Uncharacterized protein n=1 Tax=Gordonia alkaliphila TaxID=1053547 RepID=A0ABP8Z6Q2_9ACTN
MFGTEEPRGLSVRSAIGAGTVRPQRVEALLPQWWCVQNFIKANPGETNPAPAASSFLGAIRSYYQR